MLQSLIQRLRIHQCLWEVHENYEWSIFLATFKPQIRNLTASEVQCFVTGGWGHMTWNLSFLTSLASILQHSGPNLCLVQTLTADLWYSDLIWRKKVQCSPYFGYLMATNLCDEIGKILQMEIFSSEIPGLMQVFKLKSGQFSKDTHFWTLTFLKKTSDFHLIFPLKLTFFKAKMSLQCPKCKLFRWKTIFWTIRNHPNQYLFIQFQMLDFSQN